MTAHPQPPEPLTAASATPSQTPRGRRAADAAPALLVAEHQTEGRGRLGRAWQAEPGTSLTFSLALPYAPAQWNGLSLAVGLALAEALEPPPDTVASSAKPEPAPALQLKWPNDLWLCAAGAPGRKLGGVLIETVALGAGSAGSAGGAAAGQRMVVVGVGLNVAPQAQPSPQGLGSGYACVQELLPGIGAPAVLHRVTAPLVRALLAFQQQGFAPLASAYARRDLLRGHTVSTTLAELPQGVAEGVDDDGALRVRAGSVVQRVSSGEVSVRLQTAGSGSDAADQAANADQTGPAGEGPAC